jgi:vitamin B12 transport system substrate-binding protein
MRKFVNALSVLVLLVHGTIQANEQAEEPTNIIGAHHVKPRIIALAPHIVEILYDIGAGDQIIGTTDFADYPEQAKSIPRIGSYAKLQIERVIELQPDLIIAWQSGNPSDDLNRLAQLGFTIVYSEPKTFDDIAREIRQFGQLSGHYQQAKRLSEKMLARLTGLKKLYQNKAKITVFYELWSRPLTTIAKGSWPQQHLNICQANNPFEQVPTPFPQINIEQVLLTPVDLIIQPMSINQSAKEGFNWQDWPIIPAVKNGQIITPDADALHRMTPRSLKELTKLCLAIDHARQLL